MGCVSYPSGPVLLMIETNPLRTSTLFKTCSEVKNLNPPGQFSIRREVKQIFGKDLRGG